MLRIGFEGNASNLIIWRNYFEDFLYGKIGMQTESFTCQYITSFDLWFLFYLSRSLFLRFVVVVVVLFVLFSFLLLFYLLIY